MTPKLSSVRLLLVTLAGWVIIFHSLLADATRFVERLTRPVAAPTVPATMRNVDLERFLLRVALPPVRLGLYVKQLTARCADPAARAVATNELRRAARIRVRLARQGWWN